MKVFRDHIKIALVRDGENHNRFLQKAATDRLAIIRIFDSVQNVKASLIQDMDDETYL